MCERCERLGLTCEAKATASLRRPRRMRESEHGAEREDADGEDRDEEKEKDTEDQSAGQSQSRPDADEAPYGLTWHQADLVLGIYTASLLPLFPFVVIDTTDTSAQHLSWSKPLLLRAVLLAAAPFRSPSALAAVQRDVLARVALALVVDDARGLDALQALLVCVAWADVRSLCDERVTTLTYAALGCAHSLGVTAPPPAVTRQLGRARPPRDLLQRAGGDREEGEGEGEGKVERRGDEHSLEEQRVFLGLYLALTV